jgi:hypothetical protein
MKISLESYNELQSCFDIMRNSRRDEIACLWHDFLFRKGILQERYLIIIEKHPMKDYKKKIV